MPLFQSTLPRGERRGNAPAFYIFHVFQSTLPRGERQCDEDSSNFFHSFQSTLPRGERLRLRYDIRNSHSISIHAPTWGATFLDIAGMFEGLISIHAPTWGATYPLTATLVTVEDFNPRSHVGSDTPTLPVISNHCYFNPRSHVGSDRQSNRYAAVRYVFQSTLPRGERHNLVFKHHLTNLISIHAPTWGATGRQRPCRNGHFNFNPRSHVGSDITFFKV